MSSFRDQFVHPTGILGEVVGLILAYENRDRNQWAVLQLDIQPDDRALEIGFGPGLAIQMASQLATDGLVAGVDHSAVMLGQASRRNRRGVAQGRIDLRQGSAAVLPFADNTFDKAFTVNSFHQWSDSTAGLQEVRGF